MNRTTIIPNPWIFNVPGRRYECKTEDDAVYAALQAFRNDPDLLTVRIEAPGYERVDGHRNTIELRRDQVMDQAIRIEIQYQVARMLDASEALSEIAQTAEELADEARAAADGMERLNDTFSESMPTHRVALTSLQTTAKMAVGEYDGREFWVSVGCGFVAHETGDDALVDRLVGYQAYQRQAVAS